ncbi:2TM domain-containing protein [Pendulispora brunnea]|uniref:2TM domain-containing protein n=1 Tax=Pendulispora brunnea TaxID=2905690 RepID=A0ABZ2K3B7_9BACT
MTQRRYSDEEVRAILEMALKKDDKQGVGHDELLAAAAEVGISREAIEAAALELDDARGERQAREAILARRRKGLVAHLWPFVAVNAFLAAINLLTSPHVLWFLFPLLGWGLGMFFHARSALSKEISPKALAREFKRNEQQARKARREKTAKQLGAALDQGVEQLLTHLTREVRDDRARMADSSSKDARKRIQVQEDALDELEPDDPSEHRARRSR